MPRKKSKDSGGELETTNSVEEFVMVRGLKLPAGAMIEHGGEKYRRGRGKQKAPTKTSITIRLDVEIVTHFRAGGQGWQSRINGILKRAVEKEKRPK